MKKTIYLFALVALLATALPSNAQKHRHTPRNTELVDTTANQTTGVEAYSDTTTQAADTATITFQGGQHTTQVSFDADDWDNFHKSFWEGATGAVTVIILTLIVIFFTPIGIILLIFYFLRKSRQDKIRLAEMAIQNGQPIPEGLLNDMPATTSPAMASAIKHCCLGIGLMVFLGIMMGDFGFGIGALVFFIGLGRLIPAYMANRRKAQEPDEPPYTHDRRDNEPKR